MSAGCGGAIGTSCGACGGGGCVCGCVPLGAVVMIRLTRTTLPCESV